MFIFFFFKIRFWEHILCIFFMFQEIDPAPIKCILHLIIKYFASESLKQKFVSFPPRQNWKTNALKILTKMIQPMSIYIITYVYYIYVSKQVKKICITSDDLWHTLEKHMHAIYHTSIYAQIYLYIYRYTEREVKRKRDNHGQEKWSHQRECGCDDLRK